MNLSPEDARKKKLEAQAALAFSKAMTHRENKAKDEVHRKDFVLGKEHYFIQQPSEWETSRIQLGQEVRVADGAYDVESHITVTVDDVPDFLDQIADYHVLPRYTDLLEKVTKLEELVERSEATPDRKKSEVYFDGFGDGFKACITGIKSILKGN